MSDSSMSGDAIVIERLVDAPIALVWQMWTDAEHFKNWYGPEGFTVPVAEIDARVGGKRLVCMEMQTPEGSRQMWTAGEHTEIVPNEHLVYTESPSNENGEITMFNDDGQPFVTTVTVQLEAVGGQTKMVMTHAGMPSDAQGANMGWNQAFGKLATYIKSVNNS